MSLEPCCYIVIWLPGFLMGKKHHHLVNCSRTIRPLICFLNHDMYSLLIKIIWEWDLVTHLLTSHTEYLSPCVMSFFLCDSDLEIELISLYIHICFAELGLNAEVTELVNECEQPGLVQSLLLPEDLALRHLPALSVAHRRLDFNHRNPSLSPLQEVNTHAGFRFYR